MLAHFHGSLAFRYATGAIVMGETLKIMGQIAGIGGLALGVFLLLFRDVIRIKIFPTLTKQQAYHLIRLILILVWTVAIAGIAAWTYIAVVQQNATSGERNGRTNVGSDGLDESRNELIQILELRAQQIITELQDQGTLSGDEQVKSVVNDTVNEFEKLHKQNVEALRDGQLTLSHELTQRCRQLLSQGATLAQLLQNNGIEYYNKPDLSRVGPASGAIQWALRYPTVDYIRDLQQIGTFAEDDFVNKELVAIFNHRAIIVSEQLRGIPNVGDELEAEFARLHSENVAALKKWDSVQSQSTIYYIEMLFKKAKEAVEYPVKLAYDPGYYWYLQDVPAAEEVEDELGKP